jgi:hypothetical protein
MSIPRFIERRVSWKREISRLIESDAGHGAGHLPSFVALVVVAASAFRLLINLNPLIKLDGYYLLSNALGIHNLRKRAFVTPRVFTSTYAFVTPSRNTGHRTARASPECPPHEQDQQDEVREHEEDDRRPRLCPRAREP